MTYKLADRVKETTSAPGTSTATLSGAATGYQSFSAGIGANNTTCYVIADQTGANWEVGIGTVGSGGTTLVRTTVLSSSNSGSLVNFASGTQDVWVDYPASKAVIVNDVGDVLVNQSTDQGTGALQVTGQSTFNGAVTDKSLNLQGGNNLLLQSNTLSNASWLKSGSPTVVQGATDPFGGTTAWTLTFGSNTLNAIYQPITQINGTTYAQSIYAKAVTKTILQMDNASTSGRANFDLINGVVGTVDSNFTASMVSMANGWYRCTAYYPAGISGTNVIFSMQDSTSSAREANSTAGSILLCNSQFELGTVASNYTPTTTAAVTTTNNINVPSGAVTSNSYSINGGTGFYGSSTGAEVGSAGSYSFSSTTASSGTADVILARDSANTLAQRNSTNAQTFRLYNTYTSSTSYETLQFDWTTTANTATISTQKGSGGGTLRTLAIGQPLVISPGYTVATLPTGVVGMRAYVTNALAPAYGVTVVGGGAVTIPVFYNGTNWICA